MIELSTDQRQELRQLSQSSVVSESLRKRARIVLLYADGYRSSEVARATGLSESRARRWRRTFVTQGMEMFPAPPPDVETPDAPPSEDIRPPARSDRPGVLPDDTEWEAAGKVLTFHLRTMRGFEEGARQGEDPYPLKKMRTSARRLRAALRVFGPALGTARARKMEKRLKRLGQTLGRVRDQDVLLAHMGKKMKNAPADHGPSFERMIQFQEDIRQEARVAFLDMLDGKNYARLCKKMESFVSSDQDAFPLGRDGLPMPQRLREVAPGRIYERFAPMRAVTPEVVQKADAEALHSLRIRGKWARYTLEFFAEVLGTPADDVLTMLKEVQDHLGAIEDASQACARVMLFLNAHLADPATAQCAPLDPHVAGLYLSQRQAERQKLMNDFPALWDRFLNDGTFRHLGLGIAAL